ncbi:protein patched homolog 1-like isoform X1 [Haliotis rubra]|uniref:protein patched homolog 1-like isoform X1 n=1 Tax=Haliotis rubra TaxID=36100 RepID=UPI001EE4F630|nr:protein patched homolog 1-like isoform X1 [Haliotis rubra]
MADTVQSPAHFTIDDTPSRTPNPLKKPSCLKRASNGIIWALESAFYRVGLFVGEHPWITIVFCLTTCGLCGLGLKTFKQTEEQVALWVPQSSRIVNEKKWVDKHFPSETRYVTMIVTGKDVLTQPFLNALLDFYSKCNNISVEGKRYQDVCYSVRTATGYHCRVTSLLELWSYNETVIRSLTRGKILQTVNSINKSPVYGTDFDVSNMLGGTVHRGQGGDIEDATATQITWVLRKDDEILEAVKAWELEVIKLARQGIVQTLEVYIYASRSFDDEGYGAINKDTQLLSAGFSIVFVFVMLSLGRFNMLEQRIYLSLIGLFSVGLAIIFAYGLATVFDVIYGPIQSIMPFLLLGIGVDDMFVIVESWKNLTPEEELLPLPQRVAVMMKHAGVSVTVTSITDIVAFGIGASTVIPALSAFCIYAALGILALYVLQSTFFVACLSLDQKRRESHRNACVCCYKHKNYTPNNCSQRSFMPKFMERYYGRALMKLPVKILVIVTTLGLLGVFMWRFILLRQDFDLVNYIPSDSYAYAFVKAKERYFPDEGIDTAVYFGGFDYYERSQSLDAAYKFVSESQYTQNGTVTSWFQVFQDWRRRNDTDGTTTSMVPTSEAEFYNLMYTFLTGPGIQLARYVKMNSTLPPISIEASYMTLRHTLQPDSADEIAAMEDLRRIIDNIDFPQYSGEDLPKYQAFAYSQSYLTYETNKVLLSELYRNLGLAGGCVLLVTLLLIANIWTSVLVFTCVVFTLIDVAGALELWGVTIDTASSVLLILSVGIAVDYSAHIGHTFMTVHGDRNYRSILTLKTIGPAVFNGGFSTFLAFVLLANSSSYGFALFFRVFMTVVIFGLFHGLAYLPVILSWVGPQPYESSYKTEESTNHITVVKEENSTSNGPNGHVQMGVERHPAFRRPDQIGPTTYMTRGVYIPRPDYSPPLLNRSHLSQYHDRFHDR